MLKIVSFLWHQARIARMEKKLAGLARTRIKALDAQRRLSARIEAEKAAIKARTDVLVRPDKVIVSE